MKTANFICPFDPVTRITTLPTDVDGKVQVDWVHITHDEGNTVVVQVRGEDAVIDSMKADPQYQWLEDVPDRDNLGESTEKDQG